jgi:hypothetical protein
MKDGGKNRNRRVHAAHYVGHPDPDLHGVTFRRVGNTHNTTQPLRQQIIACAMCIESGLPEASN